MRILKKTQLLVVLLAACSLSFGAVEQTRSEKSQLQFTISDKPVWWDPSWGQPMQIAKPTHAAVFHLKNVRNWKQHYGLINVSHRSRSYYGGPAGQIVFQRWTLKKESSREPTYLLFSLPQGGPKGPVDIIDGLDEYERDVLEEMEMLGKIPSTQPEEGSVPALPPAAEAAELWVYGNSKEEARANAETIIDLIGKLAYAPMKKTEQNLRVHRERIQKLPAEIPELERKRKELDREVEEHKKTVHYRSEVDAQRSILEWTDLLNTIEVDLVGIKARLAKIKELTEASIPGRTHVYESLIVMRMGAEVELAGALARKDAAQSFSQKAANLIALSDKAKRLSGEIRRKQDKLAYSRKSVPRYEEVLAKLQAANIQPVEVVDNEVKIHPVE